MLARQSAQAINRVSNYSNPVRKIVNVKTHRHVQQYLVKQCQQNRKFTEVFKKAYKSLTSLVPHAVSVKLSKEESFVLDINEQSCKRNQQLARQILISNYPLIILCGRAGYLGGENKYALFFVDGRVTWEVKTSMLYFFQEYERN